MLESDIFVKEAIELLEKEKVANWLPLVVARFGYLIWLARKREAEYFEFYYPEIPRDDVYDEDMFLSRLEKDTYKLMINGLNVIF